MRKSKETMGKMMVGSRKTKEKGPTDRRPPSRFKIWWGWKEIHQNHSGPLGRSTRSNKSVLPYPLFESPNRIILTKNEWVIVVQSCLTLCDPMDYSLTDSSVHGILQQEYQTELPFSSLILSKNWQLSPTTSIIICDLILVIR